MLRLVDQCDFLALKKGQADVIELSDDSGKRRTNFATPGVTTAMVLGANGFVGCHLVSELSRQPNITKVVCLIRRRGAQALYKRLEKTMQRYKVHLTEGQLRKIECVASDFSKDELGISRSNYKHLQQSVDAVFHVAGTTDYETPYEDLRQDHVLSTVRILNFCNETKQKQFHYLSSTGRRLLRSPIDFEREPSWWYSGYTRMKWVNEAIIDAATRQFNTVAGVYTAPYILGTCDRNLDPAMTYSFWRLLVECARIRRIWDGDFLQFIPVDLLCRVMVANCDAGLKIPMVTPTLSPPACSEIARRLDCQAVPAEDFFGNAPDLFAPQWKRLVDGVSYREVEKVNCHHETRGLVDTALWPCPVEMLERGLRQRSIQHALKATSRNLPATFSA